jgi:uncharacterized protein (TIGR02466 family)
MTQENNTVLIFPTFLKIYKNFINKSQCLEILKELKKINTKDHKALTKDNAKSSHNINNNINYVLGDKINTDLLFLINQYAKEYGISELKIKNSWYNIQLKNSVLSSHSHPSSVISGVLYLKTDSLSSKIFFHNPNPYISFTEFNEHNYYNFNYVHFNVDVGSLILFPSWLIHGSNTTENKSDERICFSFNTEYKD